MDPVTSLESKQAADDTEYSENDKNILKDVMGLWSNKPGSVKSFTVDGDIKSGVLDWKQQGHIRTVREENLKQFTYSERAVGEHDNFIRQVRQTGVTLITNKAKTYGFGSPDEEGLWANFGQGAPEVGPIPDAPEKDMSCTMDEITME